MGLGYPWTVSILNIWSGLCSVAAACLRLHYSSFRPQSHDGRKATSTFHSPSIHPSVDATVNNAMPSSFLYLLFTAKTWTRNKGRTDETATCSLPFHFPAVSLSISPRQSPSAAVVRRRWRPIQFASRDESSILTERRMDGSQWEEDWEERRQKGWTDGVSKREGEGGGR